MTCKVHLVVDGKGRPLGLVLTDDQKADRARCGSAGGQPRTFDIAAYKGRNVVERCFNKLKNWRGIATRYDKTARSYVGVVTLAATLI